MLSWAILGAEDGDTDVMESTTICWRRASLLARPTAEVLFTISSANSSSAQTSTFQGTKTRSNLKWVSDEL
jgi:hypothetical protein